MMVKKISRIVASKLYRKLWEENTQIYCIHRQGVEIFETKKLTVARSER